MESNETPSLSTWRQHETLCPPPFPPDHVMYNLLSGVNVGDSCLDGSQHAGEAFSEMDLLHAAHRIPKLVGESIDNIASLGSARANGAAAAISTTNIGAEGAPFRGSKRQDTVVGQLFSELKKKGTPLWVDRDAVRRGQELWMKHYAQLVITLTAVLLNGFVVGRFADVLVASGYTQSPWHTYLRFKNTAHALYIWISGGSLFLEDDDTVGAENNSDVSEGSGKYTLSKSLASVLQVRCLHAFSRKRATASVWEKVEPSAADNGIGIGVPLSQYDLALVQLGFSGVTLDTLVTEMHLSLSDQEMDDYIHLWRYLGYLLGIEDAYNVCTSRTVCEAYRAGFYALVPHLTAHPRKSSVQLVHSSIEGFGRFTGATPQLYVGILFSSDRSFLDIGWAELQPPTAFMSLLVRNMLEISAKSKPMKMLANAFFLHSALMDLWWPWLKRTVSHPLI
eukprot:TRINITY_DN1898_c0_g1_i1.p1 TRINITY_DN1898_c0_g1~~TRINITY_DN1898_c0_g1_i1.p1  ORF type:complete len:450 (+),score=72.35 TRINITY_DN1898_c0_g1_i1:184-1533(+)